MLKEYLPKEWLPYIDVKHLEKLDEFLLLKDDWQPKEKQIFKALDLTKSDSIKAVCLGMDPYPTKGVPNGLAFQLILEQSLNR